MRRTTRPSRAMTAATATSVLVLVPACTGSGSPASTVTTTPVASASAAPATWGYTNGLGPGDWGQEYPACADSAGSEQSPIDIAASPSPPVEDADPVRLALTPADWRLVDDGHTIEAVPVATTGGSSPGTVEIAGRTYRVVQFHFHAPSEHTVDGRHVDVEMHVVAADEAGSLTVLGTLLQGGDGPGPGPALEPVFDAMPDAVSDEGLGPVVPGFDLGDVLPDTAEVVRYPGSLTTPPCAEGVLWDVYPEPVTVPAALLSRFTERYAENSRPTQPLNQREPTVHTATRVP